MGAEVSSGVSQAVTNATEGELKTVAGQLSEAQLKKLSEAIAACGGNPKFDALWPKYEDKMQKGGPESSSKAAIDAFKYNFGVLTSGASTMMGEDALDPVKGLPVYEDLQTKDNPELLKKTVVLKLNGGLGTGMGLDKAKSLLPVTGDKTFLDLIALQVDFMKKKYNMPDMKFMLMNSFSTSKDTLDALKKYTDLGTGSALEFVQKLRRSQLKTSLLQLGRKPLTMNGAHQAMVTYTQPCLAVALLKLYLMVVSSICSYPTPTI
jgi:UDP-N-acetylglucosamine pyrophosphorylase